MGSATSFKNTQKSSTKPCAKPSFQRAPSRAEESACVSENASRDAPRDADSTTSVAIGFDLSASRRPNQAIVAERSSPSSSKRTRVTSPVMSEHSGGRPTEAAETNAKPRSESSVSSIENGARAPLAPGELTPSAVFSFAAERRRNRETRPSTPTRTTASPSASSTRATCVAKASAFSANVAGALG